MDKDTSLKLDLANKNAIKSEEDSVLIIKLNEKVYSLSKEIELFKVMEDNYNKLKVDYEKIKKGLCKIKENCFSLNIFNIGSFKNKVDSIISEI